MGSGNEFMRVGLDPESDTHKNTSVDPEALGSVRHAVDLNQGIYDDEADPRRQRLLNLPDRLIVAVQDDSLTGEARSKRDSEFATRGHIQTKALILHPTRHRCGQEGFRCVLHGRGD